MVGPGSSNVVGGQFKCVKCGTALVQGAKFCSGCGEKVEVVSGTVFCSECGNKMDINAKFCSNCGTRR